MTLKEMYEGIVNSPMTELANDIDAMQTTIEIVDSNTLPDAPNLATIGIGEDAETILYTVKTGSTLSGITRGFQGVAKSWNQGITVARMFTAYDMDALIENVKTVDDKADGAIKESEKGTAGGVAKQDDFAAHLADDATLSKKGHVQLSNSTSSTSNTLAATPSAVKIAMDRANSAFTSANNGKTVVGNAVIGVDPSVVIPPEPTFNDLATAVGQISTGMVTEKGTAQINIVASANQTIQIPISVGFTPIFAILQIKTDISAGISGSVKYLYLANPKLTFDLNSLFLNNLNRRVTCMGSEMVFSIEISDLSSAHISVTMTGNASVNAQNNIPIDWVCFG